MPTPADREAVVAVAARLAERTADRTAWLGIDGFGAAGKTSLAAAVVTGVPRAVVVHVDDFSGPAIPEWDWVRFERELVRPLRQGRPARYQVWDWGRDVGGPWVELAPGRLVVVEGVSSTRSEVDVPWDLTVWVEAPRPVRLARALERDGEPMMARWLEDWMPSEEAYAAREQPRARADLVVDGWAGGH